MSRAPTVINRQPTSGGQRGPKAAINSPKRPRLPYEVEVADNPLADIDEEGSIEEQTSAISDAVKAAYTEAERKQQQSYADNNSSMYYRVFVFESATQADDFMRKAGLDASLQIIDGRKLADAMGLELLATDWRPQRAKPKPRLAELALPMKGAKK